MPITHNSTAYDPAPSDQLIDADDWNADHTISYNIITETGGQPNSTPPPTQSPVSGGRLYTESDIYVVNPLFSGALTTQNYLCVKVQEDTSRDNYIYSWVNINNIYEITGAGALVTHSGVLKAGNNITFTNLLPSNNSTLTGIVINSTDSGNINASLTTDGTSPQIYSQLNPGPTMNFTASSTPTGALQLDSLIKTNVPVSADNIQYFDSIAPGTNVIFTASTFSNKKQVNITSLPAVNAIVSPATTPNTYNTLLAGTGISFTQGASPNLNQLTISSTAITQTYPYAYYIANTAGSASAGNNYYNSVPSGQNIFFGYTTIDTSGVLPWNQTLTSNGILGPTGTTGVFVNAINTTYPVSSIFWNPSKTTDIVLQINVTVGWDGNPVTGTNPYQGYRYAYVSIVQGASSVVNPTAFALTSDSPGARRAQSLVQASGQTINTYTGYITNNFTTIIKLKKAFVTENPQYSYYGFFIGVVQNSGSSIRIGNASSTGSNPDFGYGTNTELWIRQIG